MIWQRTTCDLERVDANGTRGTLIQGDALTIDLSDYAGRVQCVYLDPPFFTGERFSFRMRVGEMGWRQGKRVIQLPAYNDFAGADREQYLAFLSALLHRAHKLLNERGSLFLHVDYRISAHARLLCDAIFGEEQFRNEIIWSYQTGGRSVRYFSRKHDTIFFYAKSKQHFFDITQVPCQRKEQRSNHLKRHVDKDGRTYRSIKSGGKTYVYYDDEPAYPDDVWTDLSQMQQKYPQRTGYATQKPIPLMDRIILCSTRAGDLVADLVCGSGSTLRSAANLGRPFLGVDASRHAFSVCRKRLFDTQLSCVAPLSTVPAMLDASVLPGIGFYVVTLNAYTLPGDAFDRYADQLGDHPVLSLEAVDQWHAGLINGDTFVSYATGARKKESPRLPTELSVPLLRGTVAILLIDVLGNRTLWAASGAL
ncbi:MAG: site-specific DNA-methyltransferase [Clostridiales bacterium]|nr:site-specific DNA-methyltransferase [Clostridiales bacterium]